MHSHSLARSCTIIYETVLVLHNNTASSPQFLLEDSKLIKLQAAIQWGSHVWVLHLTNINESSPNEFRKGRITLCCIFTFTNTRDTEAHHFRKLFLCVTLSFRIMSFRGPRSRPRQEEGGGLNNFRVLDQSQPDPVNTPDLPQSSRTFRVAAFVFHLGMSMLESRRGREALVTLISDA